MASQTKNLNKQGQTVHKTATVRQTDTVSIRRRDKETNIQSDKQTDRQTDTQKAKKRGEGNEYEKKTREWS